MAYRSAYRWLEPHPAVDPITGTSVVGMLVHEGLPLLESLRPTAEFLRETGSEATDCLRERLAWCWPQAMEAEGTQPLGAGPHERVGDWTNSRNHQRRRIWETRGGTIQLAIPKLRHDRCYPEFLEPRHRTGYALVSVIPDT